MKRKCIHVLISVMFAISGCQGNGVFKNNHINESYYQISSTKSYFFTFPVICNVAAEKVYKDASMGVKISELSIDGVIQKKEVSWEQPNEFQAALITIDEERKFIYNVTAHTEKYSDSGEFYLRINFNGGMSPSDDNVNNSNVDLMTYYIPKEPSLIALKSSVILPDSSEICNQSINIRLE